MEANSGDPILGLTSGLGLLSLRMLHSLLFAYTVVSLLGFLAGLSVLACQFNSSITGAISFMLWISLICLVMFFNAVVGAAPKWCDIREFNPCLTSLAQFDAFLATKLMIGASFGVPASLLCLLRRLYAIIQTQNSEPTKQRKVDVPPP